MGYVEYMIQTIECIFLADLVQLLSAAKVSTTEARKKVSLHFLSDCGSQDWMGECREKHSSTGKNMKREILPLRNNLVNSEEPV